MLFRASQCPKISICLPILLSWRAHASLSNIIYTSNYFALAMNETMLLFVAKKPRLITINRTWHLNCLFLDHDMPTLFSGLTKSHALVLLCTRTLQSKTVRFLAAKAVNKSDKILQKLRTRTWLVKMFTPWTSIEYSYEWPCYHFRARGGFMRWCQCCSADRWVWRQLHW